MCILFWAHPFLGPLFWAQEESGVKSIQRFALPLEGIHHIHSSDWLPLGMISVGDGIPQESMQKVPQHKAGLVIHQPRDALNTTTTSQTTNHRLREPMIVVVSFLSCAPSPSPFALLPVGSGIIFGGDCFEKFVLRMKNKCTNFDENSENFGRK